MSVDMKSPETTHAKAETVTSDNSEVNETYWNHVKTVVVIVVCPDQSNDYTQLTNECQRRR